MLKKKLKAPFAVTVPTSPIATPDLLYSSGNAIWGVGTYSRKPRHRKAVDWNNSRFPSDLGPEMGSCQEVAIEKI
jgi:hypothetical protein